MILLNILITIICISFVEYMMHRHYLHIKTHSHIVHHHKIYNTNTKDFYKQGSTFKEIASSFSYLLIMTILSAIIIFPALLYFKQSIVLSLIVMTIYMIWTEVLHYLFHIKYRGKLSKLSVYNKLEIHHLIHHSRYNTNYGIGSTHIDYIFKTKLKSI